MRIDKKYLSFLQENVEQKKLKQPTLNIIYSDKFRETLRSIMNMKTSNISKRLLELEKSKDKFFDMSYIDIGDDGETVTYLQSNRVERFQKENKPTEEYWTSKSRVPRKIGGFIKQLLPTFNDKSIEKFVNKFKTIVKEEDESANFQLVDGDDIVYWYNYTNYHNNLGTLGSSCMSNNSCGPYLSIYVANPERCKMLILKTPEGDAIKGRALVWKLSEPKDKIFMDRVYTNLDADEGLFTNYAKRQGWMYKNEQKYGVSNIIEPGGASKIIPLEVKSSVKDFEYFPYVDTFRYYYPEVGIMCSVEKSEYGKLYTLTDTEGKYQEYDWGDEYDDPIIYDAYNKVEIPESQAVWCNVDGVYCDSNDAVRLSYNGTHALPNSPNIVFSDYSKKYYAKKDCVFSKLLNTWIWKNYAVDVYHDRDKTKPPDIVHRFELNKSIGKVGKDYYDIDLLVVKGSKRVQTKPGKYKTECTYEFKEDNPENN